MRSAVTFVLLILDQAKLITLFRLGGEGVPGTPPLTFFGDNSKSIGLTLFNFFTFLTNTCSSLKAQNGLFIPTAWVLRQTYCLNALFYLYWTKSIFRPTSGHLNSYLESLEKKEAYCKNLCKISWQKFRGTPLNPVQDYQKSLRR